jgi:hypothetical protein
MNVRPLRTWVLVLLLGSVPISADASLNNSLPRVTAVNGRIEVGQMITVAVDNLSDWSSSHDPHKLVPYLNGRRSQYLRQPTDLSSPANASV